MATNKFVNRHVGISAEDIPSMLQAIGVKSVDELIDQTIPSDILLKEPLTNLLERKKKLFPEGESKAMFFVESLVELFDVVLSYATNSISFVRVGAFALSHAGMMGVLLTLAGYEIGSPNWIVVVLGNIVVTGLEGLVVGIQVLRLEYYEMFSRFYQGTGKPFVAFSGNRK